MNRKYVYPLLLLIVAAAIIWYQRSQSDMEKQPAEEQNRVNMVKNWSYLPTSTTGALVFHDNYTLSYSEPDEQAEWVAYELTKEQLEGPSYKRPYFEIDPKVKTGAADWRNYKNSGYDRGHLCPAADRKFDKEAYTETFLTSNISPQIHGFNSGIWNQLEQQVRNWARDYDRLYVITGGVLNNKIGTIGEEEVTIPGQFYKILLYQRNEETYMLGFLFPHEASSKPLESFAVPVDSIEKLTEIDFFPQLDDEVENAIEASVALNNWEF